MADLGPGNGNTSLEYGGGGRKIPITPAEPGVVDGLSSTAAAGTYTAPVNDPPLDEDN